MTCSFLRRLLWIRWRLLNACLYRFCVCSGQKVNNAKTQVFFLKNVNHNRVVELSANMGYNFTSDLVKYLGVPILHQRVNKNTYSYIVERVRGKLSSLKTNSLSLVGRITLGDTEESRKVHLVSWQHMCRSKQNGGLGLRHIKEQNKAFMVKLGWGLMEKKDTLWARVLRAKYKSGNDMVPAILKPQNSSRLWKGIANSWKHVEEGTIWRVGDGRRVRFWADPWLPNGKCPMSYTLGEWDWSRFGFLLLDRVCDMIAAIVPLLVWVLPPGAGWLKFNVDVMVKDSLRIAPCGGVLRDCAGKGFVRKLGWCDTLLAELWAILSALEVAWSMGCRNLVVASDSLMAINLLKNQIHDNHPYAAIISRIHPWVDVDWDVSFLLCFREGNFVADAVAGMAYNAFGVGLSLLHSVPATLEPILGVMLLV
ncbi:ribonuclease H [Senna tora]|uniref:Ribonuclease H n=1 Tax=Senna tora TaxID=362788 RepID=A0A834T0H2_9FABA|nr:ribonuclease H [Senna tora]